MGNSPHKQAGFSGHVPRQFAYGAELLVKLHPYPFFSGFWQEFLVMSGCKHTRRFSFSSPPPVVYIRTHPTKQSPLTLAYRIAVLFLASAWMPCLIYPSRAMCTPRVDRLDRVWDMPRSSRSQGCIKWLCLGITTNSHTSDSRLATLPSDMDGLYSARYVFTFAERPVLVTSHVNHDACYCLIVPAGHVPTGG